MKRFLIVLAACLMYGAAAASQVAVKFGDPALAARIDGAPLYWLSVDSLQQRMGDKRPASRTAALQAAIANRLLAGAARSDFKAAELHPSTRVTFLPDVALDDKLVAALRGLYGQQLEAALKVLPGATLNGLISASLAVDAAQWDQVFGKPGQLLLDNALNPEQLALAKKVVLLRHRLTADGVITLYDVYRRQNVQGRVELFNRNQAYVQQQARLMLAGRFTLDWARRQFGAAALDDLRLTLSDQDEVTALLALHGIGDDIEADSPLLARLAQQVSRADIGAYYQAHQDEFTRIERVRARHIRVPDEAAGKQVLAGVAKGTPFSELARSYSIAADAKSGGDLGWIVHEGKLSWLQQLAFMQPEGQVSRPFRTPVAPDQAAPWEIVLVERRVTGYQAADSESVAYVARQALARERAAAQVQALRQRLLDTAKVEVNASLAGAAP